MNSSVRFQRLLRDGHLDVAERLCRHAISDNPTDGEAWLKLAAVHQRRGTRDEALQALRVAATCGGEAATGLRAAQAFIRLNAPDEALKVLARLDTARPEVVLEMARARWCSGDYRRAVMQFAALWEIKPEWLELTLAYARSLVDLGLWAKAGEVLEATLPRHATHWFMQQQYTAWLISYRSLAAAAEWLAGQTLDERVPGEVPDTMRDPGAEVIALYRKALDNLLAADGRPADLWPNDAKLKPRWEGFCHLRGVPGPVTWYGDNAALLKQALAAAPENGLIVECGVFHGRTLNLLAAWSGRKVHGFDSFQGLPEAWSEREGAGSYSTGGRLPAVLPNATLHPGWFAETLPLFAAALTERIALLHVDCDLYSSTRTVLEHLGPHLAAGAIIVFDEYTGYAGWRRHEYRAFREWCGEMGVATELIGAVVLGRTAAFRVIAGPKEA